MALSAAIALVAMWGGIALSYAIPSLPPSTAIVGSRSAPMRLRRRSLPSRYEPRMHKRPADDRRARSRELGRPRRQLGQRAEATLAAAGTSAAAPGARCWSCSAPSVRADAPWRSRTRCAARDAAVSRASVYRILDELEGLGLVQRVETGQAMVRYERVCERDEHHHHLVCDELRRW